MPRKVVLVHGFGTTFATTWRDNGWVDLLGDDGHDVTGVDLLGHGEAPRPHDPEAYVDLGERVRAVMGDGPVSGVGFSLGGRTLLVEAASTPERFERLVVAGVGANLFRSDGPSAVADAVAAGGGSGDDAPAMRYLADLAKLPGNDPEALAACLRAPRPALTDEQLGRITCPVLVVLGDEDFTRPADRLLGALPDATYVELKRTDHARTPKSFEFIDATLDFLR